MIKLLMGLLVLVTVSSFAVDIKYTNLPQASSTVITRGTRLEVTKDASKIKAKHLENESAEIQKLKEHVEGQLNRQVIEAKCESFKGFDKWSDAETSYIQGLESNCSVSFL